MLNIVKGLDAVSQAVKSYIYTENKPGGLLEDVETIIPVTQNEKYIDPPAVWIVQHPTILAPDTHANLSHVMTLQTTFEFVCVEYDEDLEQASIKGQNLATRVGASILRNFNKEKHNPPDTGRLFRNIKFNTFYPVGEMQIKGKSERVPATGIVFDFIHDIDWLKCIQGK